MTSSTLIIGLLNIALIIGIAIFFKRAQPAPLCQPFSQIVVSPFDTGSKIADFVCTSDKPFLVYCSTNTPPGEVGYAVNVKSTGFGGGTNSPVYIVGGVANDVITFIFNPAAGTTGFLTLQTECDAKASITTTD